MSVTDIIFVVRYSFKDINYDIVMYTKNAAQTTMDTKTRISRSRSKDARLYFGVLTGEFGDFTLQPR